MQRGRRKKERRASTVSSQGARWCGRPGPGRIVAAAMVLGAAAVVGEEGVDAAVGSRASRPDSVVGEGEEVGAEVRAASPGPEELQRRRIDGNEVGSAADIVES